MEIKLLIDRNDEFYRFERLGRLLAFIASGIKSGYKERFRFPVALHY